MELIILKIYSLTSVRVLAYFPEFTKENSSLSTFHSDKFIVKTFISIRVYMYLYLFDKISQNIYLYYFNKKLIIFY